MRIVATIAGATLILLQTVGCHAAGSHHAADGSADTTPSAKATAKAAADETRRLIEQANSLPLPAGNYRIDVERVWLAESDLSAINAVFGYADEHVAVQVGQPDADPGFRIGLAKEGMRAQIAATLAQTSRSDRSQMMLVTVPDSPASLQVGEVRYAVPLKLGSWAGALVLPRGQFLGTSLQVCVRPAGTGQVSVALTPVFSGLGPTGETMVLTQMTSTVTAPLGQSLLIASQRRQTDDVASTLLSRSSASGSEQGVIVLTVTGG